MIRAANVLVYGENKNSMVRKRREVQVLRAQGIREKKPVSSGGSFAPDAESEALPVVPASSVDPEKSPGEKEREEKIAAMAAAEFDDFARNDFDVKLQRLFSGKNVTSQEITDLRESFFREKENIITEISQKNADEINSGAKTFEPEALKHRIHVGIWEKLLHFARWEKGDLFGPTVNPMDGTKDTTPASAIAMHTIEKIGSYDELKPDFESGQDKKALDAEGNEKIKALARKLIDQFTVHGVGHGNTFHFESDLDGEACLMLFKMAGFNVTKNNVEYVEKGETTKKDSSWVVDTSNKHGFVVEGLGKFIFTDHHGEESKRDSSATLFLFKGLKDFGFFEDRKMSKDEMEALEQYVEFVTKEDNKNTSDEENEKIFKYFNSNLAGLQRFLTAESVYKIFFDQCQGGKKFEPYAALPAEYLNKLKFKGGFDYKKVKYLLGKSKAEAKEALNEIRNGGMIINLGGEHGDVVIDTGKFKPDGMHVRKVGWGWEAVRSQKYGAYVIWDPERHYFQIFAKKELKFSLPQGNNVRGHYILFSGSEKNPLTVTLRDILTELSGNQNYQISPELQAAIDADKENQLKKHSEDITRLERQKKIDKIAQKLLDNRKKNDSTIVVRDPSKDDFKVAASMMRTHEDLLKMKERYSEEQLRTFGYMKETLSRIHREVTGGKEALSAKDQKAIEKDIQLFVEEELVKKGQFTLDQGKEIQRLVQESVQLDYMKESLKLVFD